MNADMTERWLESSPEYFTEGKANVAAAPLRVRCKHAVSQCMAEAGYEPPRWLHADPGEPDDYLYPLFPDRLVQASVCDKQIYTQALTQAMTLVVARIGWPGKRATDIMNYRQQDLHLDVIL